MSIPFVERPPTGAETERVRLILSTYQDGSGMLKRGERTLPGWRDFERSVAAVFKGRTTESKWIYDVILQERYGISCKMRKTLRNVETTGRVTIELSNAAGEFWHSVGKIGITQQNYQEYPDIVGETITQVVEGWHSQVSIASGGVIDNTHSFFLVLQWDERTGRYQLFQYPIDLPDPHALDWVVQGRRLIGRDRSGILVEWYGFSGGQLKYYPLANDAVWHSPPFQLQPLPDRIEFGLHQKAELYFPDLWAQSNQD